MSFCLVCKVARVEDHPNADRLSLVIVALPAGDSSGATEETVVVAKRDDGSHPFQPGDLAVRIPSGAILPDWLLDDLGYFDYKTGMGRLSGKDRNQVQPVQQHGIVSKSLLYATVPAPDGAGDRAVAYWKETASKTSYERVFGGENVAKLLGVTFPRTVSVQSPPDDRPMEDRKYTFCGWIVLGSDGDYNNALYLIDHRTGRFGPPLAAQVYSVTGYGHKQITVNYHITDEPFSEDELVSMLVARICGVTHEGEAENRYFHRYSEMTGYLWTDEYFRVGGHDVIEELRSYSGKWCHLTVTVHDKVRR